MSMQNRWKWAALGLVVTQCALGADVEVNAYALSAGEGLVIDGRLDEAAWQSAEAYSLEYQFAPPVRIESLPQTQYRVLVDGEHLYIGVRCADPNPQAIWRAIARRDKLPNSDIVEVFIDPSGQRKFAQVFRVSASGSLNDGTFFEDSGNFDFSPDYPVRAAAHIDDEGWSMELEIPASSLRLNGQGAPTILVNRAYPRGDKYLFASTDINNRLHCVLCKNPTLRGVNGMRRGKSFIFTPYAAVVHATGDAGDYTKGRAGADLKWRPTDTMVADFTANPDFSQVELDSPQLSANSTYALFYPEKRPFFLEGLDLFDTPIRSVYTRTITRPDWGARLTRRGEGNEAGLLVARDAGGGLVLLPTPWATNFAAQPASTAWVARSRFSMLGAQTGVLWALKDYGDLGANMVGGADGVYATEHNRYNAQFLASRTTVLPGVAGLARGVAQTDSAAYLGMEHDSNLWRVHWHVRRIGEEFRDDSGFVESNGLYGGEFSLGRNVPPILGMSEVRLFAFAMRKQTLDGETIVNDVFPGAYMRGPRGVNIELKLKPGRQKRVGPGRELHRVSSVDLHVFASPARWLPQSFLVLSAGHRLDALSDRVGTGYMARMGGSFALAERWRMGGNIAQEFIENEQSSVRRTLLRDTAAELNVSYFFDANTELRGLYQHHYTFRDSQAFTRPITSRVTSDVASVVYSWVPKLGTAFYAGGTWASARTAATVENAEFFVKASWAFE